MLFWIAAVFAVLGVAVMGAGWISSSRATGSDQKWGGIVGGFILMATCWAIAVVLAIVGGLVKLFT